ncbi:hypothetical protein ACOMHN_010232 [Nucella lapillus]
MATASPDCGQQWQNIIRSLYPEALSRTYRVPPEHFFRVPLKRGVVPGTTQPTFLLHQGTRQDLSAKPRKKRGKKKSPEKTREAAPPRPACAESDEESARALWTVEPEDPNRPDVNVLECDIQDDFCQNHVLVNLQALGKRHNEVMFIVSQLKFKNYGNKPCYAPAADALRTVFTMDVKDQRGEFDILVIHRHRGILVGEMKSLGLSPGGGIHRTLEPRKNEEFGGKVRKAVTQLDKSERVLKHLLQDVADDVKIRKAVLLPYVKMAQLRSVLESDSELKKDLARCLDVPESAEVLSFCCCYEQLSDPRNHEEMTTDTLDNLQAWWNTVLPDVIHPPFPDDHTYLEVVGRFVGPASTAEVHCNVPEHVEVRTHQQSIAEFGHRLHRLVLTPQQLALMETPEPQVCLTGPPGTGKTVLLVLMALRWLQEGRDVHVVSTYPGSLAVSFMMQHQLTHTLSLLQEGTSSAGSSDTPPGKVHLKFYDLIYAEGAVDTAIEELTAAAVGTTLHVLMDEAKFTTCDLAPVQTRLFEALRTSVEHLHFWTACMGNKDLPEGLVPVTLDVPLRCAPRVQSLMGPAMSTFQIHPYSTEGVAYYVGDGPAVKEIHHSGKGHNSQWPLDCELCGKEVGRELRALIEVPVHAALPNSSRPLKYKDVFVLTRGRNLHDSSGAVRGLLSENIPLTVLKGAPPAEPEQHAEWMEEVKDAAVAGENRVVVAHHVMVSGLERKVLVFLPGDSGDYDSNVDHERRLARDKLYVVSRCTTKYIAVTSSN